MKKSLLALAALTAFAGAASAQSSVTLFGVVDASLRSVKTGPVSTKKLGSDGNSSSRFGFRGVEDLGSGLAATFWLEAGFAPDTGTTNAKLFNRRSTVGLSGSFGEVRLGRDNLAIWNSEVQFDPFGGVGVGSVSNLVTALGGELTAAVGPVAAVPIDNKRADNQVAYFLPGGLGGVYGQAQFGFGEGAAAGKSNGGRLGYKGFGFDAAVTGNNINVIGGKYKILSVGASYDAQVVKLTAQIYRIKVTSFAPERKEKVWAVGAIVPVSAAGAVKATYTKASEYARANQIAVGYQHDLSKRTALYATYAQVKNKDANATFVVTDAPAITAPNTGLLKSTGYEFGLRHNF